MSSGDHQGNYSRLIEFADTEKEALVARALAENQTERGAAESTGIPKSTVHDISKRLKRKAARQGVAPESDMHHGVPEPFFVKGISTYYNAEGKPSGQWVKSASDPSQVKAIAKAAAQAFFEDMDPLPPADGPWSNPSVDPDEDLCSMYVLADLHLGMYSWAKETGDSYDCATASELIVSAFQKLFARGPDSEQCIIAQLGDLLHMDDDSNQTRRSGNPLDVDTRYHRVAEVAMRVYRRVIDMALQKHQYVHIVNVPGNHDDISGYWMGVAVENAYAEEPRLTIDNSPGPYFYYQFGSNLFGFCHGHTAKPDKLGEIMVSDVPEMISDTDHRYWMTGHIHHQSLKESAICTVESFRTLAAKDSWHYGKGYRSGRDMKCIVFHKLYGEDERLTVSHKELSEDEPT